MGRRARVGAVVAVALALVLPAAAPAGPAVATVNGSVGPGFTISLKKGGKNVRSLKAGRYRIVVRDRSSNHNFHLMGPGVNRSTSVAGKGRVAWTVRFRKGKTYRFLCDRHPFVNGSFRAR